MNPTETLTGSHGHLCADCEAEAEVVPAAYRLADGSLVCDSHLDIRAAG